MKDIHDLKNIIDRVHCSDCLDFMRGMEDNSVDLVLTDPPYGIGVDEAMYKVAGTQAGQAAAPKKDYGKTNWDTKRPTQQEFDEMRRISKDQMIFGGNYFADMLPASSCWLVWDKENAGNQFADCELVWTSFDTAVRKFRYMWNGMIQEMMGRDKETRYHPTQKPVELISRILEKYSEEGDTVMDCYTGSGSILCAAVRMGRHFIGIEINPDYCKIAEKRIQEERDKYALFGEQQ